MAIIECKECGKEISSKADKCPYCGIKKHKTSKFTWFVLFVFVYGFYVYLTPVNSDTSYKAKVETPQEKEEKDRYSSVMLAGKTVKKNLKEPNSVEWLSIHSNKEGTLACFRYKAKNSYGGFSVEESVSYLGLISSSQQQWDKLCANKKLYNVTYVRNSL